MSLRVVLALMVAGCFLPGVAIADPVLAKLNRVAELEAEQAAYIMVRYRDFRREVIALAERPKGMTTAEHRNELKAVYKKHRDETLRFLKPNQYRRWMTVAGRALVKPKTNSNPLNFDDYASDHGYDPRAVLGLPGGRVY